MPWSRKPHREKVQIDTDWLLGPAPTGKRQPNKRPTQSTRTGLRRFFAFASLVGITAVVIWKWEAASHELLRWQWSRMLSQDETTEETLAALVALSDSMEDADAMLLEQLRRQQGHRRTVAFQLLKNRIEQRGGQPLPPTQRRVTVSMLQSFDLQDRELMMMRGWLASRLLTSVSADDPACRTDREALMTMIGDASALDLAQQTVAPVSATAIPPRLTDSIQPSRKLALPSLPRLPNPPAEEPQSAWSPETIPAWASNALRSPNAESNLGATMRLSDNALVDDALGASAKTAATTTIATKPVATTAKPVATATSDSGQVATRRGIERVVTPVLVGAIKQEVTPMARNIRAAQPERDTEVAGSMRGLGKLGTDQVMRLLESTQDRLVAQAVSELEARGLKPQHVELAMELARGSSSERMAAMETLASEPEINPIPWLVWMAESGDREVRMRAISMLGATADDEALRKLRLLKQREIDNRVVDQITQVLLAAGSARSSTR